MAWYGNKEGHARAGAKGGKAQGKHNNPGNFANDPKKASKAGKLGGKTTGEIKKTHEGKDHSSK